MIPEKEIEVKKWTCRLKFTANATTAEQAARMMRDFLVSLNKTELMELVHVNYVNLPE